MTTRKPLKLASRKPLKRRNPPVKLFDVVALLADQPRYHLRRGDIGTVIHIFKTGAYEIEFSDETGETTAQLALEPSEFLVLSKQGRTLLELAA
ncbi:MAG: DUF4926 domain-containing protein [Blastocatellia bacterium]